jgi:hypothetical protein
MSVTCILYLEIKIVLFTRGFFIIVLIIEWAKEVQKLLSKILKTLLIKVGQVACRLT